MTNIILHPYSFEKIPPIPVDLIIADPPYGRIVKEDWDAHVTVDQCLQWLRRLSEWLKPGGALYWFGGIGKPKDRIFYKTIAIAEDETDLTMQDHITWKKRRAYGCKDRYLFVREEMAYYTKGDKPAKYNIPLLKEKRGYAGYNKKYPAKSEFLRRGNVWTDINEMFTGKIHPTEKPVPLLCIPIEVHTAPGDTVFDPFAGSGSTGAACKLLGRTCILAENNAEYISKIKTRLPGIEIVANAL